ncbi:MMPL family transporter [Actinomadura rudentiformis]|uniref:MMPL family transporter n=1 Tax=Actinomadura rudentiformis TaxID=359158 RepID=A0A6H9YV84_9ACTN|nr:MMPL family transporter [Actinomadura rudentiformis]KAB2350989.1 MMPL family transporter [Actinomadura rudentiformis]
MLAGLGRLIHRRRWTSLVLILIMTVLAGGWGLGVFAKFKQGGFEDPKASSTLVAKLGATYFGSTNPDVLVVYSSDTTTVDDPRYMASVVTTVSRLPKDRVAEIISYWSFDAEDAAPFASHDKRRTFVALKLAGTDAEKGLHYEEIKDRLQAPGLTTQLGGAVPLNIEFGEQVVSDIVKAEIISMPILLILLVVVFGALTASVLPLIVALFSIVGGLAVLHVVTYVTDVTSMALEVVTMMGVGLAIDYSLFIVSRFREELERGMRAGGIEPGKPWKRAPDRRQRRAEKKAYRRALRPVQQAALARTMATAGRTIAVSGITVSAALGGLLVFPQMFLRTIGLAGIATVLVAVFGAVVLLPTMLALLGTRVEAGRMPWRRHTSKRARRDPDSGFWYRLGHSVMKRPLPYFAVTLVILGVLFGPFLNVQFGSVDARVLPKESPTRAVVELVKEEFPNGSAEPIDVVVSGDLIPRDWKPVRSGDNIPPYLEEFRTRLSEMPGVTQAKFTGYSGSYGGVRISITHKYEPLDQRALDLVTGIRAMSLTKNGFPMHIDVGGSTAAQMDLMDALMRSLPKMAALVCLTTFLLLFMFFGSVVLPLKAIVMNVLSIGASFGVIVWGFQYGHLAGLLDFTPTGSVEATSMILILAVVFGLSMDYEVFLLSRIREEWDKTHDNRAAVAVGMQQTGGIITSAALLFLIVIGAFSMAGLTVVKLIGVGMFVAVVVDAALVRSLLVPATMRFMGGANWWLPPALAGLHAKMDLRERDDLPGVAANVAPPRLPDEQPYPYAMRWEQPAPAPAPAAAPAPTPLPPPRSNGASASPAFADYQEAALPNITFQSAAPPNTVSQQFSSSSEGPGSAPGDPTYPPTSVDPSMPPSATDPQTPWTPWANGQPQPRPTRTTRTKREIVPNPSGSGWRWRTVEDNDAY